MTAEKKLLRFANISGSLKSLEIGKNEINYCISGSGAPLLLLHGINIGWGQWYRNIPAFSKYFEVYAIDFPGAGKSSDLYYDSPEYFLTLVDTVELFLERVKLRKVDIVGHSLGGWVGLKLAIRNNLKINKLVLVDSMGFTDYLPAMYIPIAFKPLAKLFSKTIFYPNRDNMRKFLGSVVKNKNALRDEFVDYYSESLISKDPKLHPLILINAMSGFLKIKPSFVLKDKLNLVKDKTLIIHGRRDNLIPFKFAVQASKMIKHSKNILFDNSGHTPFLEEEHEFNRSVINFLGISV